MFENVLWCKRAHQFPFLAPLQQRFGLWLECGTGQSQITSLPFKWLSEYALHGYWKYFPLLLLKITLTLRKKEHPRYDTNTLEYDFSLLRLEREVDFASLQDVFPACWPTKDEAPGNWVGMNVIPFINVRNLLSTYQAICIRNFTCKFCSSVKCRQ